MGSITGSPLFVTSKEIIGVLSWSWHEEDDCDDDANFFYSWLHKSWGTLSPLLAPENEEALTHSGIDPISACQPIINLNRRFFPGNDWQVKNQITIQAAQDVNVANLASTVIGSSDISHFSPRHNSDYIIKAGQKISIFPGFRINVQTIDSFTGISDFHDGNQNRISFQIAPCTPFIDDCGFNHENAIVSKLKNGNTNGFKDNINESLFQFNVYPNPSNGKLELNISSEINFTECKVYNSIGTLIYSISNTKTSRNLIQIPLDNLADGIYFIKTKSAGGIISNQKFIKN